MVIDTLAQLESYAALDARFGETAKFIEKCRTENLPAGRYNWMETGFMQWSWTMFPKKKAEPLYETHDKYVDIQCMLEGSEYQWYAPRGELKEKIAYNTEKDISFYEFSGSGSRLHLTEGSFAVYFPCRTGIFPVWPTAAAEMQKDRGEIEMVSSAAKETTGLTLSLCKAFDILSCFTPETPALRVDRHYQKDRYDAEQCLQARRNDDGLRLSGEG